MSKFVRPTPLLEGAKELTFEFQSWRIRCAFLLATDGKEYAVREEYTKMVSKGIPPTGMFVTEVERDAILAGEAAGKKWQRKVLGTVEADPLKMMANQFAHLSGLTGPVWTRDDGAVARLPAALAMNMILELPQAAR